MRLVIIGGGIAAVYIANQLLDKDASVEVLIVSKEAFYPYDRIHLCSLVDHSCIVDDIYLELDKRVHVELSTEITSIDTKSKRIFSEHASFAYDYLIVATGSKPKELIEIGHLNNATTFRSANDSIKIAEGIKDKNVLIMGVGPIGLELLDTLMNMHEAKSITLLSRGEHLYDKELNHESVKLIQSIFEADPRITISFNDAVEDYTIEDNSITSIETYKKVITDPFLVFGIGIEPNVEFAKESLDVNRGIIVNDTMQSSDAFIYAAGEAAEVKHKNFVAGRVKECTLQADVAIANILDIKPFEFKQKIAIDGLKVGSFLFTDVSSPDYNAKDEANENIIISSKKDNRIDQYILNGDKLVRFIGVNSNIDVIRLKEMIEKDESIDPAYLYTNRLQSERGRLVCSCTSVYEQDIIDTVVKNSLTEFSELKPFSDAGRVCGRCKKDVTDIITATPVDKEEAARIKAEKEKLAQEKKLETVRRRIKKFNDLHPNHLIDDTKLEDAIESFDMKAEYNSWVSMVTASLRLDPDYEGVVSESVQNLNKVPIIWLELADCTGNSEAFIKTANPSVDDLILKYVSLDYHELLMSGSGDQSETVLDEIVKNDTGKYILIVEGAVPLGMDGKFLRIGPKGETGVDLLKRVAKGAAAVMAVGSCAYDGGVVAIEPNPTGAVGVAEALGRDDIINLPGCPTNPINVVGTLLHYLMFAELPELDAKHRPLWAYSQRIHDNCERRGHYDMDEFVQEWGDEGAKKGWCLFQMGCKGPYADLNCSMVKFNEGTSWPVQVGHGCFGCGEGKIAFEHLANNREVTDEFKKIVKEDSNAN
jgi:quinone-reactive Ni/Fe-hydrogenase small subunit